MHKYYVSLIEFTEKRYNLLINLIIIILFLLLPYFLFEGKLFIGGDDTRLFYSYPGSYLANTQFFSWNNLSSVGWSFPNQSFIPFVSIWVALEKIVISKMVLSYFSFSLAFILGFIFFQKLVKELILVNKNNYNAEIILGSLFYVLSPIIVQNHFLNPLIPIWLIGLIPAIYLYFLRFLKTGKYINILKAIILFTIFSFGSHNFPWIFGFLIPISIALLLSLPLFKKRYISVFVKRFLIFFSILGLSQAFWVLGFVMTLINPSTSSLASKALSEEFTKVFARTVYATSTGTIIYPLLNLFHRQIAFDFQWNLKNIYLLFYDKTYFLNTIYIVVLFFGILNFKKYTNQWERKTYIFLLIAFVISLYFFTVNIGLLRELFVLLGDIPGFIIFRNAYDKFALGYTLIYSLLITFSLITFRRKYVKVNFIYFLIFSLFLLATIVNITPIKKTIVSPLITTENIYKNIIISEEYLSFMEKIKENISSTNNILSVPYGTALYTIIKDVDSNNVYAGVSPVIIFSGVNDISGYLSFNYTPAGDKFDKLLLNKDYKNINNFLHDYNINYVLLTKNIPGDVKDSYLFNPDIIKVQDADFLSEITDKKILTSSKNNYELYNTKSRNSLITSDNLFFKKISKVKYKILIKNLNDKQELIFNDSFHEGWNLYPSVRKKKFNCEKFIEITDIKTVECQGASNIFEFTDLTFIWKKPVFEESQEITNGFSNKWIIDPNYIKENLEEKYYSINKDGTIDVELVLYFKPQVYFYMGVIISIIIVGAVTLLIFYKRK